VLHLEKGRLVRDEFQTPTDESTRRGQSARGAAATVFLAFHFRSQPGGKPQCSPVDATLLSPGRPVERGRPDGRAVLLLLAVGSTSRFLFNLALLAKSLRRNILRTAITMLARWPCVHGDDIWKFFDLRDQVTDERRGSSRQSMDSREAEELTKTEKSD